LIFKNNILFGSFLLSLDRGIVLEGSDYKKPIFCIDTYFEENTSKISMKISIGLLIASIAGLKMKINTVYLFEKGNDNFRKHYVDNGFKKLDSIYYHLKWWHIARFRYKGSRIIIKSLQ